MAAANLTGDQRQWFDRHQVKASLSVPITRQNYLLGLLMAQHCQSPHIWQTRERQFLQQLAEELQTTLDRANLIEERNESTKQAQILKELTIKLSSALNGEEVFTIIVNEIRQALKADRVIVYRFDETWAGTVIAESVAEEFPKALGATIADPCFADNYVEKYRSGRIQATRDIFDAGLTPCHLGQLKPFEVKANLVAPINYEGNLLGLLIAHQCSGPRNWHQNEIDLFGQLTVQVGLALERSDLLAKQLLGEVEQRQIREKMQQRALELLMEVDPVNRGDLTIRAKVTEDEIGTIADSYNATIENLRRIVTQVQQAAAQFTNTTGTNEAAVRQLSNEATKQAEDVAGALERLQAMNQSIQEVAENAAQAESAVQQATKTVDQGEDAMNRTVDGILAIRETVAATAKQVKRLGESSQKISKVVNLISSFADQTNLLALNAAIEAAHAGEEGRGFAVVADEVRSLARQSAEATAEISELVASIQSETNEVVNAMEAGTEQVVAGTRLVDETRRSLNQITAASAQISELVEAITAAAVEQSQTSQSVTQTMAQVAAIADKTSSEASNVATTFKDLLAVAQSLQDTVRQFKVE
jgi:methyl-accepting chemotaxis protein PixJ